MFLSRHIFSFVFIVSILLCVGALAAESNEISDNGSAISDTCNNNPERDDISLRAMNNLPWTDYKELIEMQNEIISINREDPQKYNLYFQGMPYYATSYLLRGMEINDPFTGRVTMTTGRYAFDRLSVYSGFSSENVGAPFVVAEDYYRNGYNRLSGKIDLMTDNISGDSYDHNIYSGYFTLPIADCGAIIFNGERRWYDDRAPSVKTEDIYHSFGLDTSMNDPQRLGGNWWSNYNYGVSGFYKVHRHLTFSAAFQTSRDRWSEYFQSYLFDIPHTPRTENDNMLISGSFAWQASNHISLTAGGGYFKTKSVTGDGVLFDDIPAYQRAFANPGADYYDLFYPLYHMIPPSPQNDTTIYVAHYYPDVSMHKVEYYESFIRSRIGDDLKNLSLGLSYRKYSVRGLYYQNAPNGYNAARVNNFGFDSLGNESNKDVHKPNLFSATIGGKISQNIISLTANFKIDRFQYDGFQFIDPSSPLDPFNITGTDILDEGDYKKTDGYWRLSPAFGMKLEISKKINLGVNYGSYYRMPPMEYLYSNMKWVAARLFTGIYFELPIGEVEPLKFKSLDVAMDYKVRENMIAGLRFYNSNIDNDVELSFQSANPTSYYYYNNNAQLDSYGLGFLFRWYREKCYDFGVNYTYSETKRTGYANRDYNIAWKDPNEPLSEYSSFHDRKYDLTLIAEINTDWFSGSLSKPLKNILNDISISMVGRFYGGLPYTPTEIYDTGIEGIAVNIVPTGPINIRRYPKIQYIDIKIEKRIRTGGTVISPYVIVKNLLNRDNVIYAYNATGSPDNNGWLGTPDGEVWAMQDEDRATLYMLKTSDPRHYGSPRIIYIGLSVSL